MRVVVWGCWGQCTFHSVTSFSFDDWVFVNCACTLSSRLFMPSLSVANCFLTFSQCWLRSSCELFKILYCCCSELNRSDESWFSLSWISFNSRSFWFSSFFVRSYNSRSADNRWCCSTFSTGYYYANEINQWNLLIDKHEGAKCAYLLVDCCKLRSAAPTFRSFAAGSSHYFDNC